MNRLKVALVGAGRRGSGTYLPIISKMKDDLQLVGICDARAEAAELWGTKYNVPHFTDTEEMIKRVKPDLLAIVITPRNNHIPALIATEYGISYITETPIHPDLEMADRMIQAAREKGVKIEVAENYYRVPMERIKRAMILEGIFGKILTAYNDFRGHGYHGVSLIRSYIGFEEKVKRVFGFSRNFTVQTHIYRRGEPPRNSENWQHGVIEFENGSVGIFNFTSLSYGSPLRWHNSTKFYGERGMCVGNEAAILNETGDVKRPIAITRKTSTVDGVEVIDALIADTEPEVIWENPLRRYPLREGEISVASELMSIVEAVRENKEPEYGPINGRIDQEISLAMARSWSEDGRPVELPLK